MSSRVIAIDARMIESSGIGTYLQGLLRGIKRAQSPLTFALLGTPSKIPQGPWSVHEASSKIYSLREQYEIPSLSGRLNTALLHVPHYNMPAWSAGRTVVTVHDLIHLKFPHYWPSPAARAYAYFFFHRVVPRAQAILTVSEHTKKDLIEMLSIPAERITVTYNAVDQERFQQKIPAHTVELQQLGLPQRYFLYVGNLKEFKNVERLAAAYKILKESRKDVPDLVLVGRNFIPGFDKVLAQIPGVRWLGEIRRDLLPTLYQNALAFLFPSLYEGFGLPPLEAMASGTPVMCSNRASLPEVVGDAALLIDPESTEAMVSAMSRLIDDSALRADLSAKGLSQASKFSWDHLAQQTLNVYSRCLA